MNCQLMDLREIERENSRFDDLLQARVRILRMGKRRLVYRKNRLVRSLAGRSKRAASVPVEIPALHEGEMVRVKSREKIEETLDDSGKFRGLWFIDEQFEYCDKEYRVLRVVGCFFDEARQRVVECKDTVLLEGSCCSGRQRLYTFPCDRNCFLFWHAAWLEKA